LTPILYSHNITIVTPSMSYFGYVIGRHHRRGKFRPEPDRGTVPIDVDLAGSVHSQFERGEVHPPPCICASCCFAHFQSMLAPPGPAL